LSPSQKALGAGAIVIIVLGSVALVIFVAVGSKKGYDYYQNNADVATRIEDNPLYEAKVEQHDNPLWENRD